MKKNRTFKNFADWHRLDVEEKLGVIKEHSSPALLDWLTTEGTIPEKHLTGLHTIRERLDRLWGDWNETELLVHFISPLLFSIQFWGKGYQLFSERPLQARIGDYSVHGIVDGMVASGSYEPETPYFFLHEYKHFKGTEADPLGQLLIAMLASQTINATRQPIYGCYVTGYNWRFILLEGNTYSESQAYDATNEEELNIIWLILNKTKGMIETLIQQEHEEKPYL